MIILDGSALFAILLDEPEADRCVDAIENADKLLISAASFTECLIAAAGKGVSERMNALLNGLDIEIIPLTEQRARAAADGYRIWGRGFHKAALNYGDSFAYALAKEFGCPLLFVGNDFARTDIEAA